MYGLLGNPLKHSFSKEIHNKLSNYDYNLYEFDKNEVDDFLKQKKFIGLNVTIPYKKFVFDYLDYIDDDAKNIGAVNTILNDKGKLYGYNTDIMGFDGVIEYNNIDIKNKNILIFGTGATSNTVKYVVEKKGAKSIYRAYRESSKIIGDILYDDIDSIASEINVVINTTPNGMYPHIDDSMLYDINKFKNLTAVVDIVYNPLRTKLLLGAEKLNVKAVSGLYMLIAQAVYANNIFYKKVPIDVIAKLYKEAIKEKLNIVLIGMPSCGKTYTANYISKNYDYKFIDTDNLIEEKVGNISDFINKNGIDEFRKLESRVISEIALSNKCVISTGGGSILNNENVYNLKMNGKLFFLNKSIENLKPTSDRPLSNDMDKLRKLFYERLPLYKNVADVEIDGNLDVEKRVESIFDNII